MTPTRYTCFCVRRSGDTCAHAYNRAYHPALHALSRQWRTVSTGTSDAHAAQRAVLRALLAAHGHAPERTGAEHREFDAWCQGLPGFVAMLHAPDPVTPYGKGRDSATRAGMLARGQWRGLPQLPRGAPVDAVDTPRVSGYLWALVAALAERAERRTSESDNVHRDKCHKARRKSDRAGEERRRKVRQCIRRMAEGSDELDAAIAALRAKLDSQ